MRKQTKLRDKSLKDIRAGVLIQLLKTIVYSTVPYCFQKRLALESFKCGFESCLN